MSELSDELREPLELNRVERLCADIDLRTLELLQELQGFEMSDETREIVLKFTRAAYGLGYRDAWTEVRPASLYRDHGYKLPPRAK